MDTAELARQATLSLSREPRVERFLLPRERLVGKIASGTPALHGEPVTVDVEHASELFGRLVGSTGTAPALDPQLLFAEAFVQHADHVAELAGDAGVDADDLYLLASLAVAPQRRLYARYLAPLFERLHDTPWTRGYCGVCGAWPVLGEQRVNGLSLRCASCGHAWPWDAGRCPFYDDNAARRLDAELLVCDGCHTYLKVGHSAEPRPAERLFLDDLASRAVDERAARAGFRRPTGNGFRIELAVPESEWAEDLAAMDID